MHPDFTRWAAGKLSAASLNSYLSGLRALEAAYGDLDDLFSEDRFTSLLEELSYSKLDERHNRPNPSRLVLHKQVYSRLSDLRSFLRFYSRFRDFNLESLGSTGPNDLTPPPFSASAEVAEVPAEGFTHTLERDLQIAIRANLEQVEPGLMIADGGAEMRVTSGFIDILATGADGRQVVIELKATKARRDAVAQTLAYMGDIASMAEDGTPPRGILIAPDFDARARAAASILPDLSLLTYSYRFTFDPA